MNDTIAAFENYWTAQFWLLKVARGDLACQFDVISKFFELFNVMFLSIPSLFYHKSLDNPRNGVTEKVLLRLKNADLQSSARPSAVLAIRFPNEH